uniref:NAD-dependent epimerase/dehydratase family protein n=1 Tax=Salmonella enterica TaxID=28901 RepID=UPI00398C7BDF
MAQRILVLGASGYIGQHLVFALSQPGHPVRATPRRHECLNNHRPADVRCHTADLHMQ